MLPKLDITAPNEDENMLPQPEFLDEVEHSGVDVTQMSLREWITVMACRSILTDYQSTGAILDEKRHQQLTTVLLHTAVLSRCSLQERACERECFQHAHSLDLHRAFLARFSRVCHALLMNLPQEELEWDVYDLIDGRLFLSLIKAQQENSSSGFFSQPIIDRAKFLGDQVSMGFDKLPKHFQVTLASRDQPKLHVSPEPVRPRILGFSHPVVDDYLKDVKIEETEPTLDYAAEMVFKDLHHWHNTRPVIGWKRPAPDFKERRRNQRQAAEIVSYAASLTNSRGKVLNREVILVNNQKRKKEDLSNPKQISQRSFAVKGKKGKKGGKDNALKAVEEVQNKKLLAKRSDMIQYWASSCQDFENDSSLIERYLKAAKFLALRSKEVYNLLLPEVGVYACNILGKIFTESRDEANKKSTQGKIC